MPLLRNIEGESAQELSLKAASFDTLGATAAYNVEALDYVRYQATETSAASWDSGALKMQFSLDGVSWDDTWLGTGTTLSADGISSKIDVQGVNYVRVYKSADASSTTPIVRVVLSGGTEN